MKEQELRNREAQLMLEQVEKMRIDEENAAKKKAERSLKMQ